MFEALKLAMKSINYWIFVQPAKSNLLVKQKYLLCVSLLICLQNGGVCIVCFELKKKISAIICLRIEIFFSGALCGMWKKSIEQF